MGSRSRLIILPPWPRRGPRRRCRRAGRRTAPGLRHQPAGIALGISAAARHDELLASDRSRWGPGNTEVPAYTDLMVAVRQDARTQLGHAVRGVGADGVVISAMTLRVRGDACQAHPGGTDHFAEAVITGSAIARFAHDSGAAAAPSLAVLALDDPR